MHAKPKEIQERPPRLNVDEDEAKEADLEYITKPLMKKNLISKGFTSHAHWGLEEHIEYQAQNKVEGPRVTTPCIRMKTDGTGKAQTSGNPEEIVQAPTSEDLRTKRPTFSYEILMSMKTDVTSNPSSNTKA
ncbi:unnamed protein product [Leuciscus chuanchicus]